MKFFHWITGIALVVLLALAIAGLVLTRDLGQPSGNAEGTRKPQGGKLVTANAASQPLVDQSPLQRRADWQLSPQLRKRRIFPIKP